MSNPEETPGQRLRAWAMEKYGNLTEAAADLGIAQAVLSRHLAGHRQPTEAWKVRYEEVSEGACPAAMWGPPKKGATRRPVRNIILAIHDPSRGGYTIRLEGCDHEHFVKGASLHAKMACTRCPVQQSEAVAT